MPAAPRRLVVHDYSGHPGQAQLSRALAARGHDVVHQHCPSYTTGKGALERRPDDPPTLRFEACALRRAFRRYSPVRRVAQELAYGRRATRGIVAARPDAVVLSNVPLLALAVVARGLAARRIPVVFWQQDVYSAAVGDAARRRLPPPLGAAAARAADRIERGVARSAGAVVAISPVFCETLERWGVAGRATVVPNWGPIDEVTVRPRANPWSRRHGLADVPVVLYAGTLGLKHDPSVLADLATELGRGCPRARLVVVSEGRGREWLEAWRAEHGAANLDLYDYQDYTELPDVLGTADVLVGLLEPEASRFSVPSKVLSYLCAGRAVVGVLPPDNAVAEILASSGAGVVVDPRRRAEVGTAVLALLDDDERRRRLGAVARAYAEATFSAERAAAVFEAVVGSALGDPAVPERPVAPVP